MSSSGRGVEAQDSSVEPARPTGRPRLDAERRAQIIDAFIDLVAEKGLEQVTLDDVARASGVGRPAMRHFIGNRQQLITATITELSRRYARMTRERTGQSPTVSALIDLFFSTGWSLGVASEDAAFEYLFSEAMVHPETRQSIRDAYDVLVEQLVSALRRCYPGASLSAVRDTAYAIACLIESNYTFQQLGYPRARTAAARATALLAAEQLGTAADAGRRTAGSR